MKNSLFFLLIVLLFLSCTNYEDEILIDVIDYENIHPDSINTELAVININVIQEEFDNMYENYNDDIEIEGTFSFYKNGEILINDEVIELQLKGTTSNVFPLKSLGIKFDNTYDNENHYLFDTNILPFHSVEKIKAFRLRNSGQDFEFTMIKDLCYTKLAVEAGLNIDLTYSEQTVVFINDVFLGLMNMRTEGNTNGISRLYDEDKDDVTLAKIKDGGVLEKKDGDFDKIDRFIEAINQENIDYLFDEVDIDNFIDYMIFESYIGNLDWPKNNVRFFAIKEGPFRFIMYDLDLAATQNIDLSPLEYINTSIENPITDLFNLFYSDESFKQNYDSRFNELLNSGVINSDKFNIIVEDYKSNIEHLIPTQVDKYKLPETYTEWYLNLEELKYNFQRREYYVR